MTVGTGASLEPGPILEALESFRGAVVDLDRSLTVEGAEMARVSEVLTRDFGRAGLRPGDPVVMALGNGPRFPSVLGAVLRAGGCPALYHADTPAPELARGAERLGAPFAVTDNLSASDLEAVSFTPRSAGSDWAEVTWSRCTAEEHTAGGGRALEGVPLHQTSGTTGLPKLAVRPGAAAVAEARHYIDTIGIDAEDRILCTVPMSHAYGYGMCMMVPLLAHATILTMRRFAAPRVLNVLADSIVTVYPAVPGILDMLLFHGAAGLATPGRRVFSAGAALPERTARRLSEQTGLVVRPLYGTTETGGISVARADSEVSTTGAVGAALVGVDLRVGADEETGSAARVGRLWVRSSSMMAGYLAGDGVDSSMVADGWFDTGDLASIDERGTVTLRGRSSDLINVFGLKVLPSEVEDVIRLLPAVTDVAVYGGQDRRGMTLVKAAVVASGTSEAELRAHCRRNLAPHKCPTAVLLVDALPKTPSGKVIRSALP